MFEFVKSPGDVVVFVRAPSFAAGDGQTEQGTSATGARARGRAAFETAPRPGRWSPKDDPVPTGQMLLCEKGFADPSIAECGQSCSVLRFLPKPLAKRLDKGTRMCIIQGIRWSPGPGAVEVDQLGHGP
jgi:hypothetical protein